MNTPKRINFSTVSNPVGPYSHAVEHNHTLYISGLTAIGTPQQSGSIEEQCLTVFALLNSMLAEHGADLKQLVKVTLYLTDMNQLKRLREVLFSQYGDELPASSAVEVSGLYHHDLLLEMEVIVGL